MSSTVPQVYWAGIDVSAEKFDAAAAPLSPDLSNWMRLAVRSFPLTTAGVRSFAAWLSKNEGTCQGLCAESTGIYSTKLQELLEKHTPLPRLSISNPARIKGTAQMLAAPGKTDQIDARVIAIFAATTRPVPKPPLSDGQRRLREALKVRDSLQKQERSLRNQLLGLSEKETRKIMRALINSVHRQFKKVGEHLQEIIRSDEQLKTDYALLITVPTIGPQVAYAILALFGDLRKWGRREVTAMAGFTPLKRDSGKTVRGRAHISKRGGGLLRGKQYLGTAHLLHKDYGFNQATMERAKNAETKKPSMISAMRKVLLVARAVVISGEPFNKERAA